MRILLLLYTPAPKWFIDNNITTSFFERMLIARITYPLYCVSPSKNQAGIAPLSDSRTHPIFLYLSHHHIIQKLPLASPVPSSESSTTHQLISSFQHKPRFRTSIPHQTLMIFPTTAIFYTSYYH